MPGWLQAILVAVALVVASWLLLNVLARRLPPGVAKDLAGFLPDCVTAMRVLRRDPRVPRRAKVAVVIAMLWVLSPIDLIPEFLPVIGPLDECGVWQIRSAVKEASSAPVKSDGTRSVPTTDERSPIVEFACNLASRAESDLRVPENLLKAEPTAALAAGWFSRPIWFYMVLAAWLLATVEWFLYQRRWIS